MGASTVIQFGIPEHCPLRLHNLNYHQKKGCKPTFQVDLQSVFILFLQSLLFVYFPGTIKVTVIGSEQKWYALSAVTVRV